MKPADNYHDCWLHFAEKHLKGAPDEQVSAMKAAFYSGGYVAARSLQLVIASGDFSREQMEVGANMLLADIAAADHTQSSDGEVLQ